MALPNHLQRAQSRRESAAIAARLAEEANPWHRACQRAREFHLPPSVKLVIDALAERKRKLGRSAHERGLPVLIGYGDGTEKEQAWRGRRPVQRPRHPAETTLTELTGLSRRSVIRAIQLLDQLGLMHRHRMYGEHVGELDEREYKCRTRAGLVRDLHRHLVGRGGCGPGGKGNANCYHPDGVEGPEHPLPPVPRPRSDPSPVPSKRGSFAALLAQQREQRHSREHDRGP